MGYCREKCIDGKLILPDMALGYKCAELICSVLMDKDFYISHLVKTQTFVTTFFIGLEKEPSGG